MPAASLQTSRRKGGGIVIRGLKTIWRPAVFAAAVVLATAFVNDWGVRRQVGPGQVFLGFTQRDVPLYYAYAREVFERGNGLLYPNPYEWEREPDRIYCQLVFILTGGLWWLTGAPMPALDLALRLGLGFATLMLLWRLLGRLLPSSRLRWGAFVFASLCGGLAWAVALGRMAAGGSSFLQAFVEIERGYRGWFFLWRQLFLATELFYHCLAFGVFLGLATGRNGLALALLFLTWWSHPFTGLQAGAIAALFLLFGLVANRGRGLRDWAWWGAVVALNAAACVYYGPFLESFESHRAMTELWVFADLRVFPGEVAVAHGVWIALSLPALFDARFRRWVARTRGGRLWAAWLIATVVLMSVHRLPFLKQPSQPLHFERGYLLTALAIAASWSLRWIGLRLACVWGGPAQSTRGAVSRRLFAVLAAMALVVTIPDSVFYLKKHFKVEVWQDRVAVIPRADWEVVEWFQREAIVRRSKSRHPEYERILVLEANPVGGLDYLLPTFTPYMTALGHLYNTTHYQAKRRLMKEQWLGQSDRLMRGFRPQYVVQPRDRPAPRFETGASLKVFANDFWAVYGDSSDSSPSAPPPLAAGLR